MGQDGEAEGERGRWGRTEGDRKTVTSELSDCRALDRRSLALSVSRSFALLVSLSLSHVASRSCSLRIGLVGSLVHANVVFVLARSLVFNSPPPSRFLSLFLRSVPLTVVDLEGRRHALRGLEGQSVADVLSDNIDTFSSDVVALSPEGSDAYESHVKIPAELFPVYPAPTGDAAAELSQVAADGSIDEHSRLASSIKLTKAEGPLLIGLGALAPWHTW